MLSPALAQQILPPHYSFAQLLSSGGLDLDAHVLASLFQDSALTTPVTATGQSVGGWRSLATNKDALEATALLRPVYTITAGRPTVVGDGSTQYLSTTYLFGAVSNCIVFDVDVPATLAAQQVVFGSVLTASPVRFTINFNTSGNLACGVGNIAAAVIKDSVDWRGKRCVGGLSVDSAAGLISLYTPNGLISQTAIDGLPSTTVPPFLFDSSNGGAPTANSYFAGGIARVVTAPKAITLTQFNSLARQMLAQ